MACKRKSSTKVGPTKKREIAERINHGFSTDKGTIAILDEVSNIFGIDDLKMSRQWFSKVKAQQYKHVLTELALPTLSDDNLDWNWHICKFGALLNHFTDISAFYRDLMVIVIKKIKHIYMYNYHVTSYEMSSYDMTAYEVYKMPTNRKRTWHTQLHSMAMF